MGQTSPVKIMQLNSMNIWRGGEVYVFLLCQKMRSAGEPVVLVCRPGSPIDRKAREADIPVINLPLRNTLDLKSAWAIADYCRKNSIDIIHAHNGRDYWLAGWAKFFNPNLRIVITRHILAPFKNKSFHRWLYKKVDKVIAVSQAVQKGITVFPPEKITVVYNGIETEKFAAAAAGSLRQELGLSQTTKIVGMVGRINPSKGHLTFFQSIPAIRAAHPDTVFVVVGSGDNSQFKSLAGETVFLGQRGNIPEIMKDLDVFVMASSNEPFGLVTLEAMSAGAPVVAANSGGSAELVIDGETGLLFSPGDPAELAQAVVRVLTDPKLAEKLKKSGQSRASKYTVETMLANTRTIYREALNNG